MTMCWLAHTASPASLNDRLCALGSVPVVLHRNAHAFSAGPADVLRQRELFLWLAGILLANQLLSPSTPPPIETAWSSAIFQSLASKSIFYYLGWFVVFNLLLSSKAAQPATSLDTFIVLSLTVFNFVSILNSNWLATTTAALLFFARGRGDAKLRAAAMVLLALALNGYWGPKLFKIFAYYIVSADAALVGSLLAATKTIL